MLNIPFDFTHFNLPGSVGQLDGSGRWLVEFQLPVEFQLAEYQLAEYQLAEHQLEEFHLSPWNHYSAEKKLMFLFS